MPTPNADIASKLSIQAGQIKDISVKPTIEVRRVLLNASISKPIISRVINVTWKFLV